MNLFKNRLHPFDYFNIILMIAILTITLVPFWISLAGSFNQGMDYMRGGVYWWPRMFTLANYKAVFADQAIYQGFYVTIMRTVIGTVLHLLFTTLVAYGLSRKALKGRTVYTWIMLFTMFFSGGLIPTYLLYREFGLLNHFLVYVIPNLFSVWDMIIIMTFLRSIPEALIESAKIDGAGEYRIFLKFVLPLSTSVLAALGLFQGVFQWNSYFDSMMFTSKPALQTIQLLLMKMVTNAQFASGMGHQAAKFIPGESMQITPETLGLAMMIVVTAPMLIIYPFLQKYFVKGVMIGSVKG